MRDARSIRGGAVLALLAAALLRAGSVAAQTEEELAAARKLFAGAVADEDAKRYDVALDKFLRVASVKETANVRYRVASCLEALGRRAEALASYEAAERLGGGDAGAADVVRAAAARSASLEHDLPRLTVLVPADAPQSTSVRVDEAAADPAALRAGIPLDPGLHTITATALGRAPFRTGVTLTEGGRVSITVTLEPIATAAAEASHPPPPIAPVRPPAPAPATTAETPPSREAPAGAWIALGLGGAFAAGSLVSFALRASNLATLNRDCRTTSSGELSCPSASVGQVNGAHDAAAIEGPLGIGLAAGAVAAAGVGLWLLASHHDGVHVTPVVTQTGGLVMVGGALGR